MLCPLLDVVKAQWKVLSIGGHQAPGILTWVLGAAQLVFDVLKLIIGAHCDD
jgi:hypothetical protein